jgi:hypothetical protein
MKYLYEIAPLRTYGEADILPLFPPSLSFASESGKRLLIFTSTAPVADADVAFATVQRECDRVYFLTGEQLAPVFKRIDDPHGTTTQFKSQPGQSFIKTAFSPTPQQWTPKLAVQLRLWQLARRPDTPLAAKINLLFQIIECEHPDRNDNATYPQFTVSMVKPAPLTACKLLRDLVSHGASTAPSGKQLQDYIKYLGIGGFFDPPRKKHGGRSHF